MKPFTGRFASYRWIIVLLDFVVFNIYLYFSYILFPEPVRIHPLHGFLQLFYIANISLLVSEMLYPPVVDSSSSSWVDVAFNTARLTIAEWLALFIFCSTANFSHRVILDTLFFSFWFGCIMLIVRTIEHRIVVSRSRTHKGTGKIVMVGETEPMRHLLERIGQEALSSMPLAGFYSDEEPPVPLRGMQKLGSEADFMEIVSRNDPDALDSIYCTMSFEKDTARIQQILAWCERTATRFYLVPADVYRAEFTLQAESLGDDIVYVSHSYPLDKVVNRILKRAFDIVVSFAVCLVLLPFLPIIAIITKSQSPGPLFFRQKRTGMDGKTFDMLKFRSMHVNNEADTRQATRDDDRTFAFGAFMRRTSIDELPQFFNVLKGDMSIVGPRPHMLLHTATYSELINKYMIRQFVRPGVTGWAQVTGFRGETSELWQMEERVKRDVWYIKHWSALQDLRIILMTVALIFKKDKMAY